MNNGERFHDALVHVGYSLIPWRKRNDAERTMLHQAASVYDSATATHVSALESEVATLREQNAALRLSESKALTDNTELRSSRAELAGKLLEQGKVIDELRATVAGYAQANHNQFVLIQELRDRITKLEVGNNSEQDK